MRKRRGCFNYWLLLTKEFRAHCWCQRTRSCVASDTAVLFEEQLVSSCFPSCFPTSSRSTVPVQCSRQKAMAAMQLPHVGCLILQFSCLLT